jgi:hypothetical protein
MGSVVLKAGCMNGSIAAGISGSVNDDAAIWASDDGLIVLQEIRQARFLQVHDCFNI